MTAIEERSKALWTIDYPKARQTRWHQTFAELVKEVGQALGLAMAFGHDKEAEIRVDVDIKAKNVRVWVRSGEEEFVAIDAHIESAPH
jgi:hypothetical protein